MTELRPRRRPDLSYEELPEENELMLVDEQGGRVTVLNSSAGGLWLLCDGTRSADELTDLLARMFPETARAEVRERVEQTLLLLRDQGLLS